MHAISAQAPRVEFDVVSIEQTMVPVFVIDRIEPPTEDYRSALLSSRGVASDGEQDDAKYRSRATDGEKT